MTLSVVIPVYNERETILEILERVRAVPVDKQIIIIDNCSTDGTREIVQQLSGPDIEVILQDRNRKKGNSVKRGIAAARGEYTIIQDADLEYDPRDYEPLLEAVRADGVLAALGSRALGMQQRGESMPVSSFSLGRELLNDYFNVLFDAELTDIATCYKLAPTAVFQSLGLRSDGFDLDFEIAGKFVLAARALGMTVADVPIRYYPRSTEEGKKIRWTDGLTSLLAITRYRFPDPALAAMTPAPGAAADGERGEGQ
ncbi:MAG: glycosyltransferase family 2 protein [Armatimonadetes bacterium]|nr:glycosyltransferase family 2 protein [Armatimonadota bacterium]